MGEMCNKPLALPSRQEQCGGLVMIQILPGRDDYRGTMLNFIRSQDYANAWGGSFAVLSASAADFRAEKTR